VLLNFIQMEKIVVGAVDGCRIGCVFVGAFSKFGGLVYRIPAPIFGVFGGKWSTPHQ
jgi:hypothetical protein